MRIFCDDGSTNVKLAWFEGKTLKSAVSVNSFRHNWKVEGLGSSRTYNYLLDGRKYTYDPVSEDAISTTHIEYQYSDTNVLAVHHALLNSGIEPQEIDLTVTGNDSNLLIVFYVQIMPDDFVMQLHRF